jgi:hypothetical protein
MQPRHVLRIGRLACALLTVGSGLVVLPAAGADADAAHRRSCALAPSTQARATRTDHVTGVACGHATLDYSQSPPAAQTRGSMVLSRIGRARFTSSLEVTPAPDAGFYATTGTLTVSTRRGTITFDYDGLVPVFALVVGESSTGPAQMVAASGTGAYRRVSGTLDLVVTSTVTDLPAPGTATFNVRFTVDGTLSFRRPPPEPSPVPDTVTIISAQTGGGSGEVQLDWGSAATATGYRVARSESAGGPFQVLADIDVVTGTTTAADDVVNIWSDNHTYIPSSGPLTSPDPSASFHLVEYNHAAERCYRVVAYNQAGEAPPSDVVCAFPPGQS